MDIKALMVSVIMSAVFPGSCSNNNDNDNHIQGQALELRGKHPVFLPTPYFYSVHVGQRVVLECAVANLEKHRVIWRKATDPNPLTVGHESFYEDDRIMVKHVPKKQEWNLIIKRVRLTDNGVYECQVSSRLRHLRHHVLLTVKEREAQTTQRHRPDIKMTGSAYVETNRRIYLICNATGLEHPPDDLDWFLDGNKLPSSDDGRVIIRKDVSLTSRTIVSSLEINEARHSDTGNYVCRTSNMQIQNLVVTVLNADSFNVKRGTMPGERESPGIGKPGHHTGSGPGKGSGKYGHEDKDGNSASRDRGHLFLSSILAVWVIPLSRYWLFPS